MVRYRMPFASSLEKNDCDTSLYYLKYSYHMYQVQTYLWGLLRCLCESAKAEDGAKTKKERRVWVNTVRPGEFEWNFRHAIFKQILVIDGWGISCEITLMWMSLDFPDDQSALVQLMAWCRQATSHYLSQCWPRSFSPYGVTRPQWVNTVRPEDPYMC